MLAKVRKTVENVVFVQRMVKLRYKQKDVQAWSGAGVKSRARMARGMQNFLLALLI